MKVENILSWDSWKEWNKEINEHSAVIGMQFIKVLCASYQEALTKVKEEYEDAKKKLQEENYVNLTAIHNKENAAISEIKKQNDDAVREISQLEKDSLIALREELNLYLENNAPATGIRKILEGFVASPLSSYENNLANAEQRELQIRGQLRETIDAQRLHQNILYDKQIKKANAEAEKDRAKESARYNGLLDNLFKKFKEKTEELDKEYRKVLNTIMSNQEIGLYEEEIRMSVPSAKEYVCSKEVPEYVYLGEVSMEIAKKASTHPEISQMLNVEVSKLFKDSTLGKLTARLPYCQKLDDGISLFLNYSPNDRTTYQEQLRMMLLKLFMVFPAGKLEATMIDPLELGETFAMFTKLGEEQSRIIDTKIWSQEKDIEESINILRQKLETMTQAYGNDKETRLKKEPIRVLAITDFPTGFSQNALRDLQAIVRKSASYGVCVFIWANTEEISKLQESQQSVFNEIKHMLHAATANGNTLLLETARYEGVSLALDSMSEARTNSVSIISELTKGIHNSQKKIERFVDMYDGIEDSKHWLSEDSITELAIPMGIKGANTIVKMVLGRTDGSTAHHALIAGQVGAGKSTLLHTIIMSTLLNYSPDEAQLYLVDFKEGVEFKTYSKLNLPSVKVVAIDCEREFGLNILKELQKEMKRRYDLFKREADREEISEYRKITGVKMPKLLVVFDEVQELFRGSSDNTNKECEDLLGELLTLGRAAGIHIILASQNFNLIPSLKPVLFAHAAIRIAIKGSEDSARSVLGDNNSGAKQLQDGAAGAAVFNDASGKESANVIFQVGYLEKDKRASFLNKLSALYNSESFAQKYKEKTRILLTNAEDDIFNIFNQLIINKKISVLDEDKTNYCLTIGDGFEFNRKFKFSISPRKRSNLLMIGSDEKKAASMFYFIILSVLYDELGNDNVKKDNQLVHLIDLSVEDEYIEADNTNFGHLEKVFSKQVKRVKMRDMETLISSTYDALIRRMDGIEDTEERLFLMFFGINRAYKLLNNNMYEDNDSDEISALAKLAEIMKYGARYGINTIVWGENLNATSKIIGGSIERDFAQRIVFSTDNDTLEKLVMESNGSMLRQTTAVYMNVDDDIKNTHFRPYEIPAKVWVDKIASVYRDFE